MLSPHPIGRLVFDGVPVGPDAVLGEVDAGFAVAMRTLDLFRPSVGAFAVGMAQAALDATVAHVRERAGLRRSRWPHQQSVAHRIADMATQLEAARLLVYAAAAAYDEGTEPDQQARRSAMAKLYATEAAQQIIDGCVQLHGARRAAARPPARAPLPRRALAAHLRGRVGDPALDHRPRPSSEGTSAAMTRDYRFRASAAADRALAALPLRQGRRRRHRHPRPAGEAEPADLRELRRPARPAGRAAAPPGRAGAGHPRRGARLLRRRRRQRDHRRADQDGAARPDAVHQDDRRRHPGHARVPDPDHHRDPRHRRRGRARSSRWPRTSAWSARRAGSRSCSPRSGCPAATWARPTCCRAWSASAGRPSC